MRGIRYGGPAMAVTAAEDALLPRRPTTYIPQLSRILGRRADKRCSIYSQMPAAARIADPSNDGPSTTLGILFHAAESDPAPSTSLRQCVRETHAPRLRLKDSCGATQERPATCLVVGHRRNYQLTTSTPVWTACTVLNRVGRSTALNYSPGSQSRMGEQRARG
jgi:hypothetical protein